MAEKKSLNDHLFDRLNALSGATKETIDLEIKKTEAVISVAGQVLAVSRMKLDIITAGSGAIEQFGEIDSSPLKRIEAPAGGNGQHKTIQEEEPESKKKH